MNNNLSRRNVVKGAAWAVPAVTASTALPSVAASQGCVYTEPHWGKHFVNSELVARREARGGAQITTGGLYASNLDGDIISPGRLAKVKSNYPWVSELIAIAQNGDGTAGSLLHVDFSGPASCVQFLLHDIDSQGSGKKDHYRDSVTVTTDGAPITASPLEPEFLSVTGNGSNRVKVESPFEHGTIDKTHEWNMNRDTKGTVLIKIKGPINRFSILYLNEDTLEDTEHNYQQIALSTIRWSKDPCGCEV
ncbi:twin-arginine translocation signal domain-containing protein [Cutibacterium sp. V970]|uniref:twin-arginine translocation signal domain-containing protein n=1 Tax=Cutibacterium sp. V970 TaxID=3446481 RepID=UPI003EE1AB56